jgi:peptidoglycan hydrolase-like protein with peptidoglycan-binding domain
MTGEPDGVIGPATLEAVKTYQRSKDLGVDGFPSLTLLKALQREPPPPNVEAKPTAEGPPANVGQDDTGGLAPSPEGLTSVPKN